MGSNIARGVAGVVATLTLLWVVGPVAAAERSTADEKQARGSIFIESDHEFNATHGVRSGSGTRSDPYVISGWKVDTIHIKDTSAHYVIRDNVISRLILNWTGSGHHIHHNDIGDLRVNENIKRKGEMTSGVIEHNRFGRVGQLRHFDGVFRYNQVGTIPAPGFHFTLGGEPRAVNFDGFNGARFVHNEIYGYMDARLHGHHHSSGWDEQSHYHGAGEHDHAMHQGVDHTVRYHRVLIANNEIHASGYYALAYLDTAHAANDRTAASETEESLNKPHVHYTKVDIRNNELIGSGLHIDVFNADDQRHTGTATGKLEITGNTIRTAPDSMPLFGGRPHGIVVYRATDVNVRIANNRITATTADGDPVAQQQDRWRYDAGIRLEDIDKAHIALIDNSIANARYGISAYRMTASVHWMIDGLETSGVETAVYYDENSVENEPHSPDEHKAHQPHDHDDH